MNTNGGWIILDKDAGLFSRTAGWRVARLFGIKKFGHIGTLDPMASGVLAIAIGDATKMIPFVEDANPDFKEYLFTMQFGVCTDTLDITGNVLSRNDFIPRAGDLINILPEFIGDVYQRPPIYSAVHVDGRRAYEMARMGKNIEMPMRRVHIFDLNLVDMHDNVATLRMQCGRGTYVRAVARDIAQKIGAIATVSMIHRTVSGAFDIKSAIKLDFLENMVNNGGDIGKYLMPVDYGLGDIPVFNLGDKDATKYINGGFISNDGADGLRRVYGPDGFIGIGYVDCGLLRPRRTI